MVPTVDGWWSSGRVPRRRLGGRRFDSCLAISKNFNRKMQGWGDIEMDSSAEQFEDGQEVEPVVRAGAAHGTDDIMLWVHIGDVIAEGFGVDCDRDPDDKHPTLVLRKMSAQQLFDDLWSMGFRPEPEVDVTVSADVTAMADTVDQRKPARRG